MTRSLPDGTTVPVAAVATALLLLAGMMTAPSFAHTTIHVEQYAIEVGWGIEPPIVGIRNDLVFKITEPGATEGSYKGVTSAFSHAHATIMFGGVSKKIEISSDPRPGYYFSPIIPTKTGGFVVQIEGEIHGVAINERIPIEDVESTAILDFPPAASSGGGVGADVAALKNAISSMQQDITELKKSGGGTVNQGGGGTGADAGASYGIAFFGLAIAAAAIVLAVIAMVRRR